MINDDYNYSFFTIYSYGSCYGTSVKWLSSLMLTCFFFFYINTFYCHVCSQYLKSCGAETKVYKWLSLVFSFHVCIGQNYLYKYPNQFITLYSIAGSPQAGLLAYTPLTHTTPHTHHHVHGPRWKWPAWDWLHRFTRVKSPVSLPLTWNPFSCAVPLTLKCLDLFLFHGLGLDLCTSPQNRSSQKRSFLFFRQTLEYWKSFMVPTVTKYTDVYTHVPRVYSVH